MMILLVIAVISLILGILISMDRESLKKFEALMNRPIVNTANLSSKYHKMLGFLLIVFAIGLSIVAFSLRR